MADDIGVMGETNILVLVVNSIPTTKRRAVSIVPVRITISVLLLCGLFVNDEGSLDIDLHRSGMQDGFLESLGGSIVFRECAVGFGSGGIHARGCSLRSGHDCFFICTPGQDALNGPEENVENG